MHPATSRITALLIVTALTACSESGGSSNPIPAKAPVAVTTAPASTDAKTRATFVVHWPSAAQTAMEKRRDTLSPSTQSISVTVNGGSPTVVNKPALTGSPSTTSVSIVAPPGNDGFTFSAWDQLGGTGNVLDQVTTSQNIIADANNTVSASLDGICAALVPTLTQTGTYVQSQSSTVAVGSGSRTVLESARLIGNFPKTFQFTRVDADGNTILTSGGAAAITVVESGTTPHVTIAPAASGVTNTMFTLTPILAEPDGVATTITATSPTCGTGTPTFPNSFQLSTSAEVIVADYIYGLFAYDQDGTQLASLASAEFVRGFAYNPKSNFLVYVQENTSGSGGSVSFHTITLTGTAIGSGTFTPQSTPGDDVTASEEPGNIVYDPANGVFVLAVRALDEDTAGEDGAVEEYAISGSTATFVKAASSAPADPLAVAVLPSGNFVVNDDDGTDLLLYTSSLMNLNDETVGEQSQVAFDSTRGRVLTLGRSNGGMAFNETLSVNPFDFTFPSTATPDTSIYSPGNDELYVFTGNEGAGISGGTITLGGSTVSNLSTSAFPGINSASQALVIQ